jgi:ribosomal-protein-alanine N-acetyltransferase
MMNFIARLFSRRAPELSPATARDAAALAALHGECFPRGWSEDEMERLLIDRAVIADRATVGRTTVGFILSRMAGEEAEILSVAVAPTWRGRGISTSLLMLHLRRLAGHAMRAVFLEVGEQNEPARRLYARAGFEEVGRRQGYYQTAEGESATALVLRRDLG